MKKFFMLVIISTLLMACQLTLPFGMEGLFQRDKLTYLYGAVDNMGNFSGEVVLSDLKGREINRFDLPEAEDLKHLEIYPTRTPGVAVIKCVRSDDLYDYYWVNIQSETVIILEDARNMAYGFPDKRLLLEPTNFTRFGFFYSRDSQKTLLLNLVTGDLTNLQLSNEKDIVYGADFIGRFSPDENYLVIDWSGLIISTENPQNRRNVPGHDIIFSPDSKQLVYSRRSIAEAEQKWSVFMEPVDGSDSSLLYEFTPEYQIDLVGFYDDETVFIVEDFSLHYLMNTNDGKLKPIDVGDRFIVRKLFPSPSGKSLNISSWDKKAHFGGLSTPLMSHFGNLDLESMVFQSNNELEGYYILGVYDNLNPKWLFLGDKTSIVALDLNSGEVENMLRVDVAEADVIFRTFSSHDGGAALLFIDFGDLMQGYGLHGLSGKSYELGSGKFGFGGVSPDNDYAIYSFIEGDGDTPQIMLLEFKSGEITSLGTGISPAWILP